MIYDAHGQLASWTAPSDIVGNFHYPCNNEGNRVLINLSNADTPTDTVYFDGYIETVFSNDATTPSKYYSVNGSCVAIRVGDSALDYLARDPQGSNSMVLNNTGQIIVIQHYSLYGTGDYTWSTMPTRYSYAGERLDSQTGLL